MRKKYINQSSFQFRYAVFLFLLMLVITLFVSLSVFFTLWIELLKGEFFFEELIVKTGKLVAGKIGVLLIFEAILCFLLSHRIAGPISRIEKVVGLIRQGDFSRNIQIRKTDELNEFVGKINRVVDVLREQSRKEKNLMDSLSEKVKILNEFLTEEKIDNKKIIMLQEEIEENINRLKEGKENFKLE